MKILTYTKSKNGTRNVNYMNKYVRTIYDFNLFKINIDLVYIYNITIRAKCMEMIT